MIRLSRILFSFVVVALLIVRPQTFAQSPAASDQSTEDFAHASVATSQLRADPPELVEQDEEPEFIREFWRVQWRSGDPIDLYVIRPAKTDKPPVVLYLYGHTFDTDMYHDDDWCREATSGGYAAVGFVLALAGHRYHDRPMKEWFVSELQEALASTSHDVQMALNYLATRADVDTQRVGIFGVDAGATVAIVAASADSRIKAVDLLNPWGDWPVWVAQSKVIPEDERASYNKPEFLHKVAGFDPVALLPTLKTSKIRLTQLDDNANMTPEVSQKKMEAALPGSAVKQRFKNHQQLEAVPDSGDQGNSWIKRQLKSAGSH